MFYKLDINCDVGEGIGNEASLMPYISSCNIACTAHAGSVETIDEVLYLANKHSVKSGIHPSFPDRENFGRTIMKISNAQLQKSLEYQITLVKERATKQSIKIHHIKLHGALYNLVAKNEDIARVVFNAITNTQSQHLILYAPHNTVVANIAQEYNMNVKFEAFADRNYNRDLSLVSRKLPNAIISDKKKVLSQVLNIIRNQKVKTITNEEVTIVANTLCVHGDHSNAIEIVKFLSQELPKNQISID